MQINCIGYNRILLPSVPVFRDLSRGRFSADASILPFILEECISRGAIDIVIDSDRYSAALNALPDALKTRIVPYKNSRKIAKMVQSISYPILEEFGMELEGLAAIRRVRAIDYDLYAPLSESEISESVAYLVFALDSFLIALEEKLQFHWNITAVNRATKNLYRISRNPMSRAHLATLAGVFITYRPVNIDTLEIRSISTDRLAEAFQTFVEDTTYRHMSEQAYSLGFPERLERAVVLLRRCVKRIVSKPHLTQIIDLGSKYVVSATNIPLPDSQIGEEIIRSRYLPPIIDLSDAMQQAVRSWREKKPDFIPAWGRNSDSDD